MLTEVGIITLTGAYTASLYKEWRTHIRALNRVPIRIHVNGTRGKSTTTRLIAAGLRAGGIRTVAKTTGTTPRIIFPDGSERPIIRHGSANIGEQIRGMQVASAQNAEAIVFECMAVNPEYQWICEHRIIRSTIGVITNAQLDHTDLMGPHLTQISSCLSNTIPRNGTLVTSETDQLEVFRTRALALNSSVLHVDASMVKESELSEFSYQPFAENVAIALEICRLLNINRKVALKGMREALPDPGVLKTQNKIIDGKQISFTNAFAANDTNSTKHIWDTLTSTSEPAQKVLLYCARRDRPARNAEYVKALSSGWNFDLLILAGQSTQIIRKKLIAKGIDESRISDLGEITHDKVPYHIIDCVGNRSMILAAGNIVGLGDEIASFFLS